MNATFKSKQTLGNKPFKAGKQVIGDHLAGNQKFKKLVQSGEVIIHPRDASAQSVLVSKGKAASVKAEISRKAGLALTAHRLAGVKPQDVTEALVPGTADRIAAKAALRAAAKAK